MDTISGYTAGDVVFSPSDGGGIWNSSTLDIDNNTISGNTAGDDGGGIWNSGSLDIDSSTLIDNTAGGVGGGILTTAAITDTNNIFPNNDPDDISGSWLPLRLSVKKGSFIYGLLNKGPIFGRLTGIRPAIRWRMLLGGHIHIGTIVDSVEDNGRRPRGVSSWPCIRQKHRRPW